MSTAGTLDLWSDDIRVNVLTPVAILRTQVSALSRKTEGILRAEVRSEIDQTKVEHHLVLIAPALNDYQITLLQTSHDSDLVYPARIKSRGLLPPNTKPGFLPDVIPLSLSAPDETPDERTAETQDEFIKIVGNILRSGWVRSLIQSLIARSNDILAEKAKAASGSGQLPSSE